MGRISQFFWFMNMEELPPKRERDMIFTHLDAENDTIRKMRREYRRELLKQKMELIEKGKEA